MSEKKSWDLTSTSSLAGAAEWIRTRGSVKDNDVLLVLVIRATDIVFCVDPRITPKDAGELIRSELRHMVDMLAQQRMGKG